MSKKVHAVGGRSIGGQRVTACNAYMADGRYAVTSTPVAEDVSCLACLKALAKAGAA